MSDVNKKPRKISCLPCRTKKAKCDRQMPHCSRCIRTSRENQCIYPKPRTFGRPPKRAVFLKNQDLAISSSPKSSKISMNQQQVDIIQCREFIFENTSNQHQLIKAIRPQNIIKYHDHILDIERIFSLYVTRGYHLRQKLSDFELNPQVKMKSLLQQFTWLAAGMISLTIKRACQLVELDSFFDPEITITAFLKNEESNAFFFNTNQYQQTSPLDSIPPEQAIQLIDYFFQIQPNRILLNKTKLLHDYWNDSVEPLLLSVIYGIAIYTCQQTSKGNGFKLWDTNRNPFLNYAYILMEKFFIQKEVSSLGNYQAAVILGNFETMFGLPKHGMTILSLSYMMASDLGIFEYLDESVSLNEPGPKIQPKIMPPMDPIDKEQLINTYWAALRSTAYGCVELGLYLRENILFHGQPFPPANASTSASYQYDKAHNNHLPSSEYLIESFHTEIVTAYFSSKLFACLPKTEYNLFGCKTTPATPPSIQEIQYIQDHHMLLQLLTAASSSTANAYDSLVDCRIQMVLHDFSTFIQQEKHRWSCQQSYTIETTYHLYCIHFSFMKPCNNIAPIRHHKIISKLDLNDMRTAARIRNLQPTTWILICLLQQFLKENEGKDLNDDQDPTCLEDDKAYNALLPFDIMAMALETIVELTMLQYQLGASSSSKMMEQINAIDELAKHRLFWLPRQKATTKMIYKKLKEFLRQNHIPTTRKSAKENIATLQQQSNTPSSTLDHQAVDDDVAACTEFWDETFAAKNTSESSVDETFFLQDFDALFQDLFVGLY